MKKIALLFLGGICALLGIASSVHSATVITAVDTGGQAVFTIQAGSSIDLTGAMPLGLANANAALILPNTAVMVFNTGFLDMYELTGGPSSFGAEPFATATSSTGDTFALEGAFLIVSVPQGYISGSALAGTMTFPLPLSFYGVSTGTYVWTLPSDTVTLNVSAVPVPATVWLFGSGLGLLGLVRRKTHSV